MLELLPDRVLNARIRRKVDRSGSLAERVLAEKTVRPTSKTTDLVQDDDAGVLDQSSSERDETALADGEIEALVLDCEVEAKSVGGGR